MTGIIHNSLSAALIGTSFILNRPLSADTQKKEEPQKQASSLESSLDKQVDSFLNEWGTFRAEAREYMQLENPVSRMDFLSRLLTPIENGHGLGLKVVEHYEDRRNPHKSAGNKNSLSTYFDIATRIIDSADYGHTMMDDNGRLLLSQKEVQERQQKITKYASALEVLTGVPATKLRPATEVKNSDGTVKYEGGTIVALHLDESEYKQLKEQRLVNFKDDRARTKIIAEIEGARRTSEFWYNRSLTYRESVIGRWIADPIGEHANALIDASMNYQEGRPTLAGILNGGDALAQRLREYSRMSREQKKKNEPVITTALKSLGNIIDVQGWNLFESFDGGWGAVQKYDAQLSDVEHKVHPAIAQGKVPVEVIVQNPDGSSGTIPLPNGRHNGRDDAWPEREKIKPQGPVSAWEMQKYQGDPKYGRLLNEAENLVKEIEGLKETLDDERIRHYKTEARTRAFGQSYLRVGGLYLPEAPNFVSVPEGATSKSKLGASFASYGKPLALNDKNRPTYSWHLGLEGAVKEQTNTTLPKTISLNGGYELTLNTNETVTDTDLGVLLGIARHFPLGKDAEVRLELGGGGYIGVRKVSTTTNEELKSTFDGYRETGNPVTEKLPQELKLHPNVSVGIGVGYKRVEAGVNANPIRKQGAAYFGVRF